MGIGICRPLLACGLILAVFSQPILLPLESARAETTAHRIKRKLHKMERRTGTAFAHMGIVVMEEVFPPLSDPAEPEESDDDCDLFSVLFSASFRAGRSKPESHHQSDHQPATTSTAKPAPEHHSEKKK